MAKSNILIKSKLKKANTLVNEGKLAEAKTLYLQLYKKNRTNPEVGLKLAVVHRKLGDFKETELICKQVLANAPDNAYAHHIYGSALQCLGHNEPAISEYKKAISLDPLLIEAHYFLGNIYQLSNEQELAVESYKNAIKLSPDFFEALNNLGAILIELHQPIEAKHFLDRALKIEPNSNQLLCNITDFYLLTGGNPEQAFYYANKAYNADPNFVDALKSMGKYYYQKPDYDKALEFYKKAYAISPDHVITGLIAQILERQGEFDEANKLITPLITSGSTDFQILMTFSALSRKFNNQRMAIDAIENTMGHRKFDKSSMLYLHSELGKQYDGLKEYDRAFANYQKANQLDREFNQDIVALNKKRKMDNIVRENIDGWFRDYPADFWKNVPCSGNNNKRPIFIIGMFRSGTTLCEQIFSSHPDVTGAGELRDINQISFELGLSSTHDKSPAYLENISRKKLIKCADNYLETLNTHSTDTRHVVDKMPSNFQHIGLISRLFPDAHIIHMVRDPRDTCLSMYFQRFDSQMIFST